MPLTALEAIHPDRRRARGTIAAAAALLVVSVTGGCVTTGPRMVELSPAARAARPILELDPHACWTEAFNELVALGPDALTYLMENPAMTRPAPPDSLDVLVHTSLVRLLAHPASGPPRLSAMCLETTLGVLHFEIKVSGRLLGTVVLPRGERPRCWHTLYPLDFDHGLAEAIDLEGDRLALRAWWLEQKGAAAIARPLSPLTGYTWRVLGRRHADRWSYLPQPRAVLCSRTPQGPGLLEVGTDDYNLVRAACIWLGSRPDEVTQRGLIELVGSRVPVIAHNAQFALGYSPDPRIREVLRRRGRGRLE